MIISKLKKLIRHRFDRWLTKRLPASLTKTLDNKSIFIFPTRLGFAYLMVLMLIFLLGTNYQNNVIILLAYVLASLFITAMLQSYYNFKSLTISATKHVTGYAKHYLDIPFTLNSKKPKYGLVLEFQHQPKTLLPCLEHEHLVLVKYFAKQRGAYSLPRLKISSEYTLGLFKTWTWCDFGTESIIYPEIKPIPARLLNHKTFGHHSEQDDGSAYEEGIDDFYELNTYKEGEPLTHVAWKQLARGQGKYTKTYRQPMSSDVWLSLSNMPGSDLELKLSYLCYLVTQYMPLDIKFGLNLNGEEITPNTGQQHYQQCLTALALFNAARTAHDN